MADIKYIDLKDNDAVQFHLFPDFPETFDGEKLNFNLIDDFITQVNEITKNLSENYMWHNEEFQISPENMIHSIEISGDRLEPFSFYGSLSYCENVEDEWFTVYLLVELTKRIEGLIVSVRDGDGEFLLIEAADYLPSWVTPETSEGKTFIYKGELHILPPIYYKDNENFRITKDVLKYVRENSQNIKSDHKIQQAIEYKISGFPNKIVENFHYAVLYVPVGVASLLNANENLIAPAVRAFCDRDLIDIKTCKAMKYFPPENRVFTRVKFTKLLYVMLASSKYIPDKITGWNLPETTDENYKSHLLGIKLACGFEILINQAKFESNRTETEECDFNNDPGWKKFLKSLKTKNYFRGLLEHSKQYNQLLQAAKEYYINSCGKLKTPTKAKEVLEMLNKLDIDIEELKKKEVNLPKSDDDSWMNITKEELDSLLESRFGSGDGNIHDLKGERCEISHHLDDFINHTSEIEGAEFPKYCKSRKTSTKAKKRKTVKFSPDTKISETSPSKSGTNSCKVDFEPDGFINAIQSILDFSIPDDNYWDSEGSGMSSYEDETDMEFGGKMKPSSSKDNVLIEYMKKMDEELSHTTLGNSFITKKSTANSGNEESFEDAEEFSPVDIDVNALKNIISSYKSQMGEPGPAENLLGPLGVNLNDIEADID